MAEKTIEVDISPTGDITIEAVDFDGKGCTDETKAIEDALGTVSERTFKSEFRQTSSQVRQSTRIGER